ncbi:hypothetical protein KKA14_17160, partial [bacterium]|nr:hypothetical protein [bacterium]
KDATGRVVEKSVQFTVVKLGIVSPTAGEKIQSLSSIFKVPFQYEAEGPFDSFTTAFDDYADTLLTAAPGEITPLRTTAGYHRLTLRGYVNEFGIGKEVSFKIGGKNISATNKSINYTYSNCDNETQSCDVDVVLKIVNTGEYDIDQSFMIRFDHITTEGDFQTQTREIGSLAEKGSVELVLNSFKATLGDTFLLTIDPFGEVLGELSADNTRQIKFQTGEIISVTGLFPESNVYMEDVSFLAPVQVVTAGPIEYVEFKTPTVTFVDNTSVNGFQSIVDVGLLKKDDSCVQVTAFGSNNVVLDSKTHCFNVKSLSTELKGVQFPWSLFDSGTSSQDSGNLRIITSEIDFKDLLTKQNDAHSYAVRHPPTAVAKLMADGSVTYDIFNLKSAISSPSQDLQADFGDIPMLGGKYNLPTSESVLLMSSIGLSQQTCGAEGAIPLLNEGAVEVFYFNLDQLDEARKKELQKELDGIEMDLEESIMEGYQELLTEFDTDDNSNIQLAKDILKFETTYGNLWFLDTPSFTTLQTDIELEHDGYDYLLGLGAYFVGVTDLVIDQNLEVDADLSLGFKFEKCLLKESGNTIDYALQANVSVEINSLVAYDFSGKVKVDGLVGLSSDFYGTHTLLTNEKENFLEKFPEEYEGIKHLFPFGFRFYTPPLMRLTGDIEILAQHFRIPMKLIFNTDLFLTNSYLLTGPSHTHLDMSLLHNQRLLKGDLM